MPCSLKHSAAVTVLTSPSDLCKGGQKEIKAKNELQVKSQNLPSSGLNVIDVTKSSSVVLHIVARTSVCLTQVFLYQILPLRTHAKH